jgi:hypothetical protein
MKWFVAIQSLLVAAFVAGPSAAGEAQVLPLRVLYVGNTKSERAQEFAKFLKGHFVQASIADRVDFAPEKAATIDVVILDWPQSETDIRKAKSPFGELKEWSKPTVLLGSAGLLLAGSWQLIGGAG